MWFLLARLAVADPPAAPPSSLRLWLGAGVTGAVGPESTWSLGGGGVGELGLALGKDPARSLGLQFEGREMVLTEDLRSVGGLSLVVRYPAGVGPYTGLGFAHTHEQQWDDFVADPGGTIAAISPEITHRTGFSVVGGYDFPAFTRNPEAFGGRFRLHAQAEAVVLPLTPGPVVYVLVDFGLRFGLLKPYQPPTPTARELGH